MPSVPDDAPIKNYDPETAGEGVGWTPTFEEKDENYNGPGAVSDNYSDELMERILSGQEHCDLVG